MKVSNFHLFTAIFAAAFLVGVLGQPLEVNEAGNDGGITLTADYDHEATSNYQKLVASLRLVDALVQNSIFELEQAQHDQLDGDSNVKNGRSFIDQLLNRKSRLLNKRMKTVALGFGK